jgi:RNA polymerase sigma-70 factor (ECF subfamily)
LFTHLKEALSGEKGPGFYAETAEKLGMTQGAIRVAVHRLRQRYRELLRLEIANTVSRPEEIEDELRHVFAALA